MAFTSALRTGTGGSAIDQAGLGRSPAIKLVRTVARLANRILSQKDREKVEGLRDYFYDYLRFVASSSSVRDPNDAESASAPINKDYHRLEKGLALPEPRPGFGKASVEFIAKAVPEAEATYGSTLSTRAARGAMAAYVDYHRRIGAEATLAEQFLQKAGQDDADPGGVLAVTRAAIHEAAKIDFAGFARARHSIRNFTGEPVDIDDILEAVSIASKSPSVCNRESRRVHVAFDEAVKAKLLSFQNGNRGFGHLAGAVLVITSDMRAFTDFGERNQCWIDGGLFAMTLNYALHARGLGACMLNWSVRRETDRAMRTAAAIPDNEAVIMMMAVGHLPETLTVAASPRPPARELVRVVTATTA